MRRQVLTSTQTESDEFNFRSPGASILLSGHAGGIWTLQVKSPSGDWIDTDLTFDEDGGEPILVIAEESYRLTGGSVGAEAWVYD